MASLGKQQQFITALFKYSPYGGGLRTSSKTYAHNFPIILDIFIAIGIVGVAFEAPLDYRSLNWQAWIIIGVFGLFCASFVYVVARAVIAIAILTDKDYFRKGFPDTVPKKDIRS